MRLRAITCLAALVLAAACAPTFSDARMLGRGQVEITPSVSPTYVSEDEDTVHTANDFGVRALFGINRRINFGVGYNRTQVAVDGAEDFSFNTVAFGPKFSLVADRLAVAIPVGVPFGGDIESNRWEVHPTVVATVPLTERVDFNPAFRLLIPTCDGCETRLGFHIGFGVRTTRRLMLRPEVAFVVEPGEDELVWTFGVGASIR